MFEKPWCRMSSTHWTRGERTSKSHPVPPRDCTRSPSWGLVSHVDQRRRRWWKDRERLKAVWKLSFQTRVGTSPGTGRSASGRPRIPSAEKLAVRKQIRLRRSATVDAGRRLRKKFVLSRSCSLRWDFDHVDWDWWEEVTWPPSSSSWPERPTWPSAHVHAYVRSSPVSKVIVDFHDNHASAARDVGVRPYAFFDNVASSCSVMELG